MVREALGDAVPRERKSCFDVEALRLLLTAERSEKREPGEAVEIGALRSYDRPQPTTKNYDLLLENYPARGVIQ
jgi:hypothetical protein